jgi:NADH dehydrogenase
MPTIEKRLRVMVDWTIDIFFDRDVTRLKIFASEREEKEENTEAQNDKTRETNRTMKNVLH